MCRLLQTASLFKLAPRKGILEELNSEISISMKYDSNSQVLIVVLVTVNLTQSVWMRRAESVLANHQT